EQGDAVVELVELDLDLDGADGAEYLRRSFEHRQLGSLRVDLQGVDALDALRGAPVVEGRHLDDRRPLDEAARKPRVPAHRVLRRVEDRATPAVAGQVQRGEPRLRPEGVRSEAHVASPRVELDE